MLATKTLAALAAVTLGITLIPGNLQGKQQGKKQGQGGNGRAYPAPKSVWEKGSLILGCPTDKSVGLTIHLNVDAETFVEYGSSGATTQSTTPVVKVTAGSPVQVVIPNLKPGQTYSYRLKYREAGQSTYSSSADHHFKTQVAPGTPFMFMVQGDSHPERYPKMNVPDLYERTLKTAADQKPDLFVCLGDDFSVDTLRDLNPTSVEGVYKKQVPYLGLVGASTPIYLVNGNHEQAAKANLDGTSNSVAVLAQNARNRNFLQPAPDAFYTGNAEKVEHIGLLRNYYAWTWGDALFVTIDPYWHSDKAVDNSLGKGPKEEDGGGKRNRDLWDISLGKTQYEWLKKTLETSKAKFKFVFAHHVNGTGRGAIEQAPFYEWGGKDRNGRDAFAEKRPGWSMPIHQLFVKNGVSIFFQGHDHIFVKQELDGVIYQSCPTPADTTNSLINGDAYQSGDKVPGAGLVRVSVGPDKAKVEYLRAFMPEAETDGHKHGEVAYSYEIKPRGSQK